METAQQSRDVLYDPIRQQEFYESSKAWIESLAERSGLAGSLVVGPNDPTNIPYHRLDTVYVPAYQPGEEANRAEKEAEILGNLRELTYGIIGQANYEKINNDLLNVGLASAESMSSNPRMVSSAGPAIRAVMGRLKTPRNNVAFTGFHPNILALPIYAAELADAFSREDSDFDLFKFNTQTIMPYNASLAFAQFGGQWVPEIISCFAQGVLKVPASASTRLFNIDSDLRKAKNEKADQVLSELVSARYAEGKSSMLIVDPTNSTAERLLDERGQLEALRFRRVVPNLYDSFKDFSFIWPATMWWQEDPQAVKFYVGAPETIRNASDLIRVVEDLAIETGKLAGVKVYMGNNHEVLAQVAMAASQSD